jgi:uncharacterized damage-inducible protein DinB
MKLEDLRTLLDYHYWARDRALDAASVLTPEQFTRDMGSSFKSVRDTLAHLYSGEWAWYQRWHGVSPTAPLPFDQFPDVASLKAAWTAHEAKMRTYLASLDETGLTRLHEYKTLNGQPGSAIFWHMLQHVVNHGSYHRGQLTTLLRQLGAEPAKSMDLIAFYRDRRATAGG